MTRAFHQGLDSLKMRVAEMAGLARQNVLEGVQSLAALDVTLADKVIARDQQINRLDVEIERDALDLLARNQPMAQDLRSIAAAIKIITYLDRIGRYGYDIANATRALAGSEHVRKLVVMPHMAEKVTKMLDDAIKAYVERDAQLARTVGPQDELVDALYEQILREVITYVLEDPRTIGNCIHYILVARHLERVGDNACKIAEKTLYMVTGERRLTV
jgi:phosphate transport system protein